MNSYIQPMPPSPEEIRQKWQKERDESFIKHLLQRIQGALEKAAQDGKTVLVTSSHPTLGLIELFGLGFNSPDLIVLHGKDSDGADCAILSHVSAVQITLRTIEATDETPPTPRPFGFIK